MRRKRLVTAVLICAGLLMVVFIAPALQSARWSGRTDIEIQFRVTDAATGQPIPSARIELAPEVGEDSFCDEKTTEPFALVAGETGVATRRTTGCPCGGSDGWFENTFSIALPYWAYRVSADGYDSSPRSELWMAKNQRDLKRGPPRATVVIPVALHKHP